MKTKNNEQYKKTDLKVKETFIALINENRKYRITVKDICKKCGINRSTFYAHFEDINSLMDCLMTDMISKCICLPNQHLEMISPETIFSPDYIETVIEQIKNHKNLYLYYIEQSSYNNALKYAEQLLNNIVVSKIKTNNDSSTKHLHFYYAYVISGTAAIINEWLLSGTEENSREIAEIICRSLPMLNSNSTLT